MKERKSPLSSVRIRLFITLSTVILLIILFLVLVNNFVFGQFYLYSKRKALISVYQTINEYYNKGQVYDLESKLEYVDMQKGDVYETYSDTSKFYNDFNFKPNTLLEDGLHEFIKWYKEYYK